MKFAMKTTVEQIIKPRIIVFFLVIFLAIIPAGMANNITGKATNVKLVVA